MDAIDITKLPNEFWIGLLISIILGSRLLAIMLGSGESKPTKKGK